MRAAVLSLAVIVAGCAPPKHRPPPEDTSKLVKDGVPVQPRLRLRGKDKRCCGYPLVGTLDWALRYYWLAREEDFDDPDEIDYTPRDAVEVYTRRGFFLGAFSKQFIWHLRMEGSGILDDGRVVNYHGACNYGSGTCFEQLDASQFPFGRGARRRTLMPFHSCAVDPRVVPLGETLYVPELDGANLPDGTVHDGCLRADDTGGGIKEQKLDFFVVSYANFRFMLQELWQVNWVTPEIGSPRCDYLRDST
ncbi:MAG TPA: 3D domain-containing protein [Kofleriaceae bacterium]|nr:3D domain-containing protein [Kofleriaceae bacterium]